MNRMEWNATLFSEHVNQFLQSSARCVRDLLAGVSKVWALENLMREYKDEAMCKAVKDGWVSGLWGSICVVDPFGFCILTLATVK